MTSALSTLTGTWLHIICSLIFGWYLHTTEGIWAELAEGPVLTDPAVHSASVSCVAI